MIAIVADRTADEPVYEQIARQIRLLIARGSLRGGDRLPPVRSIASDLGVNLNTVARAYRLLEVDGFVSIRGRSGVEVNPPSNSPSPVRARQIDLLRDILLRLRQAGFATEEIQKIVDQEIDRLAKMEA